MQPSIQPHPTLTAVSHDFTADPDAPQLDYETAAIMRGWLRPIVENAQGWPTLIEALAKRGYALAMRNGRLWLTEVETGRWVCTMRHMGSSMRELAGRLGRPAVRPMPGAPNWGELYAGR